MARRPEDHGNFWDDVTVGRGEVAIACGRLALPPPPSVSLAQRTYMYGCMQ